MDLLLIVRDALASSLAGNAMVALAARGAGREVAILLTGEALSAVARGSFRWPRELSGQAMRLLIADRAKELGLPLASKGEARQLDVRALLDQARSAGARVYACPIWSALLDLQNRLPDGLQALDREAGVRLVLEARQVVGSF